MRQDTVLHDVDLSGGTKVAIHDTSADRDETVFADSQDFDIRRLLAG